MFLQCLGCCRMVVAVLGYLSLSIKVRSARLHDIHLMIDFYSIYLCLAALLFNIITLISQSWELVLHLNDKEI